MLPVIRYQAHDNTLWETVADALARDEEFNAVADIMRPLGARHKDLQDYTMGLGYVQHDPEVVLLAKLKLIENSRPFFNLWDIRNREMFLLDGAAAVNVWYPPSWFTESNNSLNFRDTAFNRLFCIDTMGREWGRAFSEHRLTGEDGKFEILSPATL